MPTVPPNAPQRHYSITQHGKTRDDPYFWLRNKDDPETLAYLKEENAYLEEVLKPRQPLREKIFNELKSRVVESDLSVPERRGDFYYYTRMEPGKQYPIYCRKQGSLDSPEQVLLDQNLLAEGQPYCALGAVEPSPDQNKLAYAVDYDGSEDYTLVIKDLRTMQELPDRIPNVWALSFLRMGVAWANDSQSLFYTTYDHTHRPDKAFCHSVGSDPATDNLVYHEADEAFNLFLFKTRSQAYIILLMRSHHGTEVRVLAADQPGNEPLLLKPRQPGVEYYATHQGNRFLIHTDQEAPNFKLMVAPCAHPTFEHWEEVIPHRPEVMIESVEPFQDYLVLVERKEGFRQARISAPDLTSQVRYIDFPEPVYTFMPALNPEYNTTKFRFTYTSLITPYSVIDYDMASGQWEQLKQDEIPGGYDPALYQSERLFAAAPDGKRVPISLIYQKGLERNGQNPTLLTGYGSYGASSDPFFSANRLSLLERGFIFAIAHVRGGSEMGRLWYENGRRLYKKNTFTDFIACAEHLIAEGYTRPEKLAIHGVSAGGLLVGASMTMRPDLFKVVIAQVPFVDVVNTMSDPTIPLTVIEYSQWGNPADETFFDYMMSYSPYDNLKPADYPDILLTASLNDPRVPFWEPAKFAARLRKVNSNHALVLLKTNLSAGHGGSSGRYSTLKDVALIYTFICDRLGVDE